MQSRSQQSPCPMMKNPDETLERGCYPSPAGELEGGHDRHPREDWWRCRSFVSPRHLSCVGSGTVIDHCRCLGTAARMASKSAMKWSRAPLWLVSFGIVWTHFPDALGVARQARGALSRHSQMCRGDFLRRSGATTVKVIHISPARYWNRRKWKRRVIAFWFWNWPSRSVMRAWKRR
jgi:hypothetical protein